MTAKLISGGYTPPVRGPDGRLIVPVPRQPQNPRSPQNPSGRVPQNPSGPTPRAPQQTPGSRPHAPPAHR